jgi:hypothetical protein
VSYAGFSSAPAACSGRGACLPVTSLQSLALTGGLTPIPRSQAYSAWEAPRSFACRCDRGYGGPDCSLALCPRGDYTGTMGQQRRALVLSISASGIGGVRSSPPQSPPPAIYLTFMGASHTLPVSLPSLTSANCAALFFGDGELGVEAGGSTCRVAQGGDPSSLGPAVVPPGDMEITLSLQFAQAAVPPPVDNLFTHSGDPPLSAFSCTLDPSLPPAYAAGGLACTTTYADLNALTLAPASGPGSTPPQLPPGVHYLVSIDTESHPTSSGLSTARVTKVVGGSPPTSTLYPPTPLSPLPAAVGDPADNLALAFGALAGHTRGATWRVGGGTFSVLQGTGIGSVGTNTTAEVLSVPGYREYTPCSGGGVCDASSGTCRCFPGFYGSACEQSGIVTLTPNAPIQTIYAPALDYAGDILAIVSQRPPGSPEFNYFTVSSAAGGDGSGSGAGGGGGAAPLLALRGDGVLAGGGGLLFSGGGVVDGGLAALLSTTATAALAGGGSSLASGASALSVYFGGDGGSVMPSQKGGLAAFATDYPTTSTGAGSIALLRVSAPRARGEAAAQLFAVGADGSVAVGDPGGSGLAGGPGGGLVVAGGTSLLGGTGLDVVGSGGVRVGGGGLVVQSGAMSLLNSDPNSTAPHFIQGDAYVNGTISLLGGNTLVFTERSPGGLV